VSEATCPTPARRLTCTVDEYHRDPCARPSLSCSIATLLVNRSPAHAHAAHPRLGGASRETSDEMDFGTIVHTLVLGKGADVDELAYDDFRTKAAKEARDNARACGRVPVLERHMDRARAVAETIRVKLAHRGIVLAGESEVAIEWQEQTADGVPVLCRSMLDHVLLEDRLVIDVKTSRNAHPEAFGRAAPGFGYDLQSVVYPAALEALHPHLAGRVEFVFAVIETEPPYEVLVARPDGTMRELGTRRWMRAVETWARCLAADRWPGYGDGISYITVPPWMMAAEEASFG
jgi:hypothetical protein